ncbi:MAG: YceD family protein, partial [Brachymonas sp.]|nr:YceD family protein [Brachymonas sp.]
LVYGKQFDLLALVEDELLMALPLAPRHETCAAPDLPVQASDASGEENATPHPFAALQQLKKPR